MMELKKNKCGDKIQSFCCGVCIILVCLVFYVSQVTSLRAFIKLVDAFAKISTEEFIITVNIHCMSTLPVVWCRDLHARLLLAFFSLMGWF